MLRHARFTHMHSGGRAAGIINVDEAVPKYVYADNAIPGEEAEVTLLRRKQGFRQGAVHHLLTPSPHRVAPFCPHADLCGGCNWQHLSYDAQLHWKRAILVDALSKYGIVTPPVPEVIPGPQIEGYRNKSEYAFSSEPENRVGFHPKEERECVFACETCSLQAPHVHQIIRKVFNLALQKQMPLYRYSNRTGRLKAIQIRTSTLGHTFCILYFTGDESDVGLMEAIHSFMSCLQRELTVVDGWYFYLAAFTHFGGKERLCEKIDDLLFAYTPAAFFQPNPLQAVALYRQIADYAQLTGAQTVYDLYTGIGTIACCLAANAKQVIGIEGNSAAILDAQHNALLNNIHNASFIAGDILETFTPDFVDRHPKADLIVLDPPRSGTLTEIKKALIYAAPQKIIYVSCNPVSLAWDLKQLCAGGYRITHLQPFDMFPHTHHVETVCLLEQ